MLTRPPLSCHFIKSLLTIEPSDDLCVIDWGHGPAHVFGGVELAFPTNDGGNRWRAQAQMHAAALVQATGGVVGEEYGALRVIVPERWAYAVHQKLGAQCLDLAGRYDASANEARLVTAGVARWMPVRKSADLELALSPLSPDDAAKVEGTLAAHGGAHLVSMRALDSDDPNPKATISVHCMDGLTYDVRVPVGWCAQLEIEVHCATADVRNSIRPDLNRNRTASLDDEGV